MTDKTCNHAVFDVAVTVHTRWSVLWVRAMQMLAPIVGAERAIRWAQAGAWHLARYRIGKGRWQRFSRDRSAP